MAKIFALDIGTNSIGWTLIDNVTKEILRTGVRVFPEGVNDINTSKEKTKNATRRGARGTKKLNYRFKMRRNRLKKVLKHLEMLPDTRYYSFDKNESKDKFYLTKELYKLRKDALEVPMRPVDLGRIFLHINNHRGFKSNKKEEADKEFADKKDIDKIETLEQKLDTLNALLKKKEILEKEILELKFSNKKDAKRRIDNRSKRIRLIEKEIIEIEKKKTLQEKINEAKLAGKITHGTLGEYYYYLIEENKNSYNPNSANLDLGRLTSWVVNCFQSSLFDISNCCGLRWPLVVNCFQSSLFDIAIYRVPQDNGL